MKQGKSASDIPTEYIKTAVENPTFLEEMTRLYQTVWITSRIPKSWGHSNLVAIWKGASKGKKTDEKAYRGLQIGSSLCKVLIVIIIKRIRKWYDLQLTDNQQGFRSGRGTTDGIYIAIENSSNNRSEKVLSVRPLRRLNGSIRPHSKADDV